MRAELSVTEAWVSYLIPGEMPESVAVNTGFDAVRGMLGQHRVVQVMLPYEAAQAGFPAADAIDAMDDVLRILAPVRDRLGLQQMGWRIGAGRRALWWLVEAGQVEPAAQDLARELTGAVAQLWDGANCTLVPESADVVYRDCLAPDAGARPFLHEGAVVLGLPESGEADIRAGASGASDLAAQQALGRRPMARLWRLFSRKTRSS